MNQTSTGIPANLITGFLGAGKTSAIQSLLVHRPPQERWAILVNEYGMVSLDHILLNESDEHDEGVHVDELAGGCFCCTLSMALPLTLARLIRRAKPHRILLEPTGSGHPASVIDMLRTGRLAEVIDLKTTICLIDPRDYENPRITNNEVFRDQIQMADVVAINFTDKCDRQQIDRCRGFIEAQDPPKLFVAETTFGRLQPAWLDLDGIVVRPPNFADAHSHDHQEEHSSTVTPDEKPRSALLQEISLPLLEIPTPQTTELHGDAPRPNRPVAGHPLRFENQGLGQFACGWIFSSDEIFVRDKLLDFLGGLKSVLRLKGVFHCTDDWWTIQRRRSDCRMDRSAYRRDSRLEIIVDTLPLDWNAVQVQLDACMRKP